MSEERATNTNVVPAKAGTHTPRSFGEALALHTIFQQQASVGMGPRLRGDDQLCMRLPRAYESPFPFRR
jgi:hypothetical protein